MKSVRPVLLAFPVAVILLIGAGALAGGPPDDLAEVPVYVSWALPLARIAKSLLGFMTIGGLVVGGLLLSPVSRQLLKWTATASLGWLLAVVLQALLTLSEVLGMPMSQALDPTIMQSFFWQTDLGRVFIAQLVAAAVVTVLALTGGGRTSAIVATVIAAAGLSAPALVGHGGLAGGHTAATVSLALHLLALGLWIGGLVAVCRLAFVDANAFATVLPRFSAMALGCVFVVAESGLVNASLRLPTPGSMLSSWYGQMILAKLTLLCWLILAGWRQRVTIKAGDDPRRDVVRLAAWEFAAMGLALGISVALARVGPPGAIPTTDAVLPLSAVLLSLALPALVHGAWPRGLRLYPEIPAVITVVVLVLAVDLAFFARLPAGSVLAAVALAGSGWLLVASLPAERPGRVPGLAVLAVAIPAIVWFAPDPPGVGGWVAVLVAESVLAWLWWRTPAAESVRRGEVAVVEVA